MFKTEKENSAEASRRIFLKGISALPMAAFAGGDLMAWQTTQRPPTWSQAGLPALNAGVLLGSF